MSDSVVFSSEEQLKLNELNKQVKMFEQFEGAVSESHCSGSSARTVAQLIQFLQELKKQTLVQIDEIAKNAAKRQSEEKKQ